MLALLLAPGALAAEVLILWDDNAATAEIEAALAAAGHGVTLSDTVEYSFDGTNPSLDAFDCVIHLNGDTYATGMTDAGQQALLDFVAAGGGFIHHEWNAYAIDDAGTNQLLGPITLTTRTSGSNGELTLSAVASQAGHPVLDGISGPVVFSAGFNIGPARSFDDQPSTVLMTDTAGSDALVVREWELGRVVGFHHAGTWSSFNPFTSADLLRLLTNAVDWVSTCDADGDGALRASGSCGGDDCDDGDAGVNPEATEVCDLIDNDCDGEVDGATAVDATDFYADADGDGYGDPEALLRDCGEEIEGYSDEGGDCDDGDGAIFPGAPELPYDGVDQDCDGEDACDLDDDGEDADLCAGSDCDDDDPDIYSGAVEVWYDGVDQDCDGNDDDADADGHAAATAGGDDCDDADPEVNPSAEVDGPDGKDNDCDGAIDEDTEDTGGGDDKGGCLCASGRPEGGLAGLLLLGLALLRRRR